MRASRNRNRFLSLIEDKLWFTLQTCEQHHPTPHPPLFLSIYLSFTVWFDSVPQTDIVKAADLQAHKAHTTTQGICELLVCGHGHVGTEFEMHILMLVHWNSAILEMAQINVIWICSLIHFIEKAHIACLRSNSRQLSKYVLLTMPFLWHSSLTFLTPKNIFFSRQCADPLQVSRNMSKLF